MPTKKIISILTIIVLFSTNSCSHMGNDYISVKEFNQLIGTFTIDTSKTNLGAYPIEKYKNLQITFNGDSTFYLNMKVPFIYDSIGKWLPTKGGVEDWNYLFYKSNPNISTQFSKILITDSIFYLNSITPQKGEEPVNVVYFKKT